MVEKFLIKKSVLVKGATGAHSIKTTLTMVAVGLSAFFKLKYKYMFHPNSNICYKEIKTLSTSKPFRNWCCLGYEVPSSYTHIWWWWWCHVCAQTFHLQFPRGQRITRDFAFILPVALPAMFASQRALDTGSFTCQLVHETSYKSFRDKSRIPCSQMELFNIIEVGTRIT